MKKLTCNSGVFASEKIEPADMFLNLYIHATAAGSAQSDLGQARNARPPVNSGITIKITRDDQGDFSIEKVEEF